MRKRTVVIAIAVCVGLVSVAAYAGDGPTCFKELGLSDQQIIELKKVCRDFRRVEIEVGAQVQLARIDLEELTEVDEPDLGKVEKQIDEIAGLQARIKKAKARKMIALKKIMGREIFEKFKAHKERCRCKYKKAHCPKDGDLPPAPEAPGHPGHGHHGHGPF